jgi:ribose transport system substrate-binding protein
MALMRIVVLGVVGLLALTGAMAASGSSSSDTATGLRYSTVLDNAIARTPDRLPKVQVNLGAGRSVSFDQGEELTIAFFGYGSGFTYTIPEFRAAKVEPKRYGVKMDIFDPAGDPSKQVAQIQDAMASGKYNAFIVFPLSTSIECNLLTKQAPAKGILVAITGYPTCNDKVAPPGVVTTVLETGGRSEDYAAWAKYIVARNRGAQEAILLTGPANDYLSQVATTEFRKAAKKSPGFKIRAVVPTNYTTSDALQKSQDILQKYPNATVIASMFPEGTQGIVAALRSAGKLGDIRVYDWGGEQTATKQVAAGHVAMSVPFYPYTKVKTALQGVILARRGAKVPTYLPYAGHAREPTRKATDPVLFITKANVKRYQQSISDFGK